MARDVNAWSVKMWSEHCDTALPRRGWKPSAATYPPGKARCWVTVAQQNIAQGKDDSLEVSSKIHADMPYIAGHQQDVQL